MIEPPHWFSGIGTPLTDDDRADAAAILSARGHASGTRTVVVAWPAAAAWAEHPAMAECWDDDEEEREVLWGRVAAQIGEAALLAQLTAATAQAAPGVRAAALAAATSASVSVSADQEVIATAAASALLALHQFRLAQVADVAPDHPFIRKYALFVRGRWALGYRDGTYGIC